MVSPGPRVITVTGAAGMIGYSLLFRLGLGESLGATAPFQLNLLDLPHRMRNLEGVAMELQDCAFPLVTDVNIYAHPRDAFSGADTVILVGANPRTVGMERVDLLESNAPIFAAAGRDINEVAADDVRIIVVGNPVNTNAMIAAQNAPDVPPERFTALMRLDHNRLLSQVARKAQVPIEEVRRLAVWGNHSSTAYPDISHALIGDRPVEELIDDPGWAHHDLIPMIAKRGSQILGTRGISSQGSAAHAVLGQLRDWYLGTGYDAGGPGGSDGAAITEPGPTRTSGEGQRGPTTSVGTAPGASPLPWDWTSAGIWSHGEYGVPEGLVCSFPVTSDGDEFRVVEGLDIDEFSRRRIDATVAELAEEREQARALGHLE